MENIGRQPTLSVAPITRVRRCRRRHRSLDNKHHDLSSAGARSTNVIHTTIRSPSMARPTEKNSTNPGDNLHPISLNVSKTDRPDPSKQAVSNNPSVTSFNNLNKINQHHPSPSQSSQKTWKDDNLNKQQHNESSRREKDYTHVTENRNRPSDRAEVRDAWSDRLVSADEHRRIKKTKTRRRARKCCGKWSCLCALLSLLCTFCVCSAIAAILVAFVILPKATNTATTLPTTITTTLLSTTAPTTTTVATTGPTATGSTTTGPTTTVATTGPTATGSTSTGSTTTGPTATAATTTTIIATTGSTATGITSTTAATTITIATTATIATTTTITIVTTTTTPTTTAPLTTTTIALTTTTTTITTTTTPTTTTIATTTITTTVSTTVPSTTTTVTTTSATTTTATTTTTTITPNCSATCVSDPSVWTYTPLARWTFENTYIDSMSAFNATAVNSPSFVAGYVGLALALNSSLNQYLFTSFIPLYSRSFTIDAWIYPTGFPNAKGSHSVVGLCPLQATLQCLEAYIQSNVTSTTATGIFSFYELADLKGLTAIHVNQWTHIAFVYSKSKIKQIFYVNGIADNSRLPAGDFAGTSGVFYIGNNLNLNISGSSVTIGKNNFQGYIDQLTVTAGVRPQCELLDVATLAARFTFDNASDIFFDAGPNDVSVNASEYTPVSGAKGGQAVSFTGVPSSYVQASGFRFLSYNNPALSLALWIQPTLRQGILVSSSLGYSFLAFTSNGSITARVGSVSLIYTTLLQLGPSWTHLVQTWSSSNGIQLYVNSQLVASTPAATLTGSGIVTNTFTLGGGTYVGAVDEWRVYSRELTALDACALFVL